jgi:hypothetical protein
VRVALIDQRCERFSVAASVATQDVTGFQDGRHRAGESNRIDSPVHFRTVIDWSHQSVIPV